MQLVGKMKYNIKNLIYQITNTVFAFLGTLLPELVVSLILLEQELSMFLSSMDWLAYFKDTLKYLDKLCRVSPEIENIDLDDIGWPGVSQVLLSHS